MDSKFEQADSIGKKHSNRVFLAWRRRADSSGRSIEEAQHGEAVKDKLWAYGHPLDGGPLRGSDRSSGRPYLEKHQDYTVHSGPGALGELS
ncbi:hypothetical protein HPP92_006952 [Vanilla planifolia]|uniref:Uncharacterized protein n=1 Tax=Vanilla planifolia TaxID=51239 RepID=A0A835RA01_VANPL|nr:hypothetical protein HPP92_007186 [Vanilla planifolia]KAG0490089.1 hypothetical protein HPP92_006952 [Vanilla planifolia]